MLAVKANYCVKDEYTYLNGAFWQCDDSPTLPTCLYIYVYMYGKINMIILKYCTRGVGTGPADPATAGPKLQKLFI